MVGFANASDGHAHILGFGDCTLHRHLRRDVAEAMARINQRHGRQVLHDAHIGRNDDFAGIPAFMVLRQHTDAVAVNATDIGLNHQVDSRGDVIGRHAPSAENARYLGLDNIDGNLWQRPDSKAK